MQKAQKIERLTGNLIPGIYIKLGDVEIDTVSPYYHYDCSVRNKKILLEAIRPLPFELSLITVAEMETKEKNISKEKQKSVVEAAIRQYEKDALNDGEEIVSYEIDYEGKEKEIKVKNKEKEEEKVK